VGPMGP